MNNKLNYIISCSYYLIRILIISIALYFVYKYCLVLIISFLLASFITTLINPIKDKINNKLLLNTIKLTTTLIFFILLICIAVILVITTINFLTGLPDYFYNLYNSLIQSNLAHFINDNFYSQIQSIITKILTFVANNLMLIISQISSIIFNVGMSFILTIFMVMDYDTVLLLLDRYLKLDINKYTSKMKDCVKAIVFTNFALSIIVFICLSVGLSLLSVDNALLLSSVIAIIDFLPIFGVDMVLVPWTIYMLFIDKGFALGLFATYMIIVVLKNIIEPKLIAHHLNTNTLLTLIISYLMYKIIGILGIMIAPVVSIIICALLFDNSLDN